MGRNQDGSFLIEAAGRSRFNGLNINVGSKTRRGQVVVGTAGALETFKGQPGAALFLILDGKIAIEIYRETSTMRLAVLERGAFFGEMALLDETPRSATARALERTRTLALYRNDLNGLVYRHPRTACRIYRSLAGMIGDRLRSTNELVQMKTPGDTSGLG